MRTPIKFSGFSIPSLIHELDLIAQNYKANVIQKPDALELIGDVVFKVSTEPRAIKVSKLFLELSRPVKPRRIESVVESMKDRLRELSD